MRADFLISYINLLDQLEMSYFCIQCLDYYPILIFWYSTKIDSDCSPDGTDYMDTNGKCHCYQGFSGDLCDDFCPEGEYGIPPNCHGNILFQPFTSWRHYKVLYICVNS